MDQTEVTVDELLGGLKRRGLPLPFEIGAFIALEACEQVLDRPVRIDAHDIGIGDIGEVVCDTNKSVVSEESAVRALLLLLSELLVCSAPGVPSMVLDLVERGPSSGEWTLDRLRDDLEASLVPLNRGATRRVLARLTREAKKAGIERTSKPSAALAASEIDAQFDAMMAQAGMSFHRILASLTTTPAGRLGARDESGKIEVGQAADLVVLCRDPTRDIRALADVAYTVRSGKIIYQTASCMD